MARRSRSTCCLLLVGLAILLEARAAAQQPTALPPFTGQHLVLAGATHDYSSLSAVLDQLQQGSPHSYYVIVIASSGSGDQATQQYLDTLVDLWSRGPQSSEATFDPQRSVLVLLAEKNRQISMHFGETLQQTHGLVGSAINQRLVDPVFLPYARQEQYAEGLRALLLATSEVLNARQVAAEPSQPATDAIAERATRSVAPTQATKPPAPAPAASTSWLPLVISLLAAGAAGAVLVRWAWYRRRKTAVQQAHEEFRRYAVEMLDRIESLKKRHDMLPFSDLDFSERLEGKTLEFYNQFDKVHGQLRERWVALMEERKELEMLAARIGFLSSGVLREIERRIKAIDRPGIESLCAQCEQHLQRLQQAHEDATGCRAALQQVVSELAQAIQALERQQVNVDPYVRQVSASEPVLVAADKARTTDPIAAADMCRDCEATTRALQQQAARAVTLLAQRQELSQRAAEIVSDAASRRHSGLLLLEPQGNPDPELAAAREQLSRIHPAIDRHEIDSAEQSQRAAAERLDAAAASIQRVLEAQSRSSQRRSALQAESHRVQTLLQSTQGTMEKLEREFTPATWGDVADFPAQSAAALAEIANLQQQLDHALLPEVQHYLAASALVDQLEQQLAQLAQCQQSVQLRYASLDKLRQQCRARAQQLAANIRHVQTKLAANSAAVGQHARGLVTDVMEMARALDELQRGTRVDWHVFAQRMEAAHEACATATRKTTEDIDSYQRLRTMLDDLQRDTGRIDNLLRSHREDRPRASERWRAARDQLVQLTTSLRQPQQDWQQLVVLAQQVRSDLEKAERWAAEDIRLAEQARAEIQQSEREIRAAEAQARDGVGVDTRAARRLVGDAQRVLELQQYEKAIQLADEAESEAREALRAAQREVELRRAQREREASDAAKARAASSLSSAGATAVPSPVPGTALAAQPQPPSEPTKPPAPTSPSSSSSRDWSSGTSQQSW